MKQKRSRGWVMMYFVIVPLFLAIAYWASAATTAVAQMIPLEREATIVIDAGHGGEDGGATSCTGVLESQFNLEISLRLNDLFRLLGHRTVMTRTTDRSVYTSGDTIAARKVSDLRNRVRMVNETEDAILISIHQNMFQERQYSGAQVFYGPKGEGRSIAEQLQASFTATLNPGSNRKCKRADGIHLMQHIDCTGILVEGGFRPNPQEEAKLRDPEYQKKICCVIASSVAMTLSNT